jgi:hypothetical protein
MRLILFLVLLSSFATDSNAQLDTSSYKNKLLLLKQIRKFSKNVLGLKTGKTFYTDFEAGMIGYYHYMYVSKSDTTALPDTLNQAFIYIGKDTTGMYGKEKKWKDSGYHTLLYRTAGTSAAKLNPVLLSYPDEDFCFIVLHEAVHVHKQREKLNIPYDYEEAWGEVCGNIGTLMFFEYLKDSLKTEKARVMKTKNEALYRTFRAEFLLKNPDFTRLNERIAAICTPRDAFRADRFLYPANRAYILRNRYYAGHYEYLLELFTSGSNKLPNMQVMYRKFRASFKRK